MSKLFNKRGISPIIATVLLVVITIAIGATTMAFIKSLTDTNLQKASEGASKISCGSELNLEIPVIQDEYKLCYVVDTGRISMLVHNTGSIDVQGFSMTLILTNGSVSTMDFSSVINKNDYAQVNITPSITLNNANATTDVLQWRIEPKIRTASGKDLTVCTDAAIVKDVDKISIC